MAMTGQSWYPGAPTSNDFYPAYTGGYSPPMSDSVSPSINSSRGTTGGIGGASASSLGTVGWGLALLALAFILMHVTEPKS